MEEKKLPLQEISLGDKTIYLLGTAHVSEESVQDVIYAIDTLKPDSVAVELDEARKKRLKKEDAQWQNMDMFKVIKEKKALFLLSGIVLSSFQKRLGESLSVVPGEEMLTAMNEANKKDIPIVLADRSAEITLKRAWNKSSFFGRQKIIASLISAIFSKETISEEELNDLKQKSTQGQMLEELSNFLPKLKEVLLDERDEYLATNIINAEGKKILAVLGAAHVPGIVKKIENLKTHISKETETAHNTNTENKETQPIHTNPLKYKKRLSELEIIPQKNKINILGYLLPLLVLGLFAYGFYKGGIETLKINFFLWWLVNGGLSFAGALIAFAHPFTMIVSFLAAPLTSLNPFIGVGMVTGTLETFLKKPRVKDFEKIQDMSLSLKSLYKNRVTHILLVFFLTSLGSMAGTFIGISILATNT